MKLFDKYLKKITDSEQTENNILCKESVDRIDNIPDENVIETITDAVPYRPHWQRLNGSCYACHGFDYWLSVHGVMVCSRCHPPACDGLVVRWGNA